MTTSDLNSLGTTVVVWAHPDDETYLSGGTAAALARHGQRVVAVTATRGEAGGPDTTPRDRARTSWVRTRELESALDILGVNEHVWLGTRTAAAPTPTPSVPCVASCSCSTTSGLTRC